MPIKNLERSEFLTNYLKYVEHTEPPQIMHVWAALTAASACIGKKAWYPFGVGDIYPNMFTLLVGPPGTRKSSAIRFASSLVRKHTKVKFAPDDTGAQRQGLVSAMVESTKPVIDLQKDFKTVNENSFMDIESLAEISLDIPSLDAKYAHVMFASVSELGTLLGEANSGMSTFLIKVWDGEPYTYKLKNEQIVLPEPLMSILGATTSSDLKRILPAESIGQGFMSRWILVFAPKKSKRVEEPFLDLTYEESIINTFKYLANTYSGPIEKTPDAKAYLNKLYIEEEFKLTDNRFVYYAERRHTHLIKVTCIIAALRHSNLIEVDDITFANELLSLTESRMPEALGEFGLTAISLAKQKLLEFLQGAHGAIPVKTIWSAMRRDIKQQDLATVLKELEGEGKIQSVNLKEGQGYVYKDDVSHLFDELDLLAEK